RTATSGVATAPESRPVIDAGCTAAQAASRRIAAPGRLWQGQEGCAPGDRAAMSLAQAVELHRQGRRAEGETLDERAPGASPHDLQCCFLLGMCLLEQGNLAEGEARMRQVLAAAPHHAGAHHALGKLQALRGEIAAAEHSYRTALAGTAAPIDSCI